jgi:hypothetical protein
VELEAVHLMAARKQKDREEEFRDKIQPSKHTLSDLLLATKPHLLIVYSL